MDVNFEIVYRDECYLKAIRGGDPPSLYTRPESHSHTLPCPRSLAFQTPAPRLKPYPRHASPPAFHPANQPREPYFRSYVRHPDSVEPNPPQHSCTNAWQAQRTARRPACMQRITRRPRLLASSPLRQPRGTVAGGVRIGRPGGN